MLLKMLQKRRLSADNMNRAIGMLQAGCDQCQVATTFNVSESHIQKWNCFQTLGRVSRRYGGGRQRVTTLRQDRFLVIQARRHRFRNATTLRNDLQNASGTRVSTQTVRNRLHDAGLRARRPAIRVPLTRRHIHERLDFAHLHLHCTIADWEPVLFTD